MQANRAAGASGRRTTSPTHTIAEAMATMRSWADELEKNALAAPTYRCLLCHDTGRWTGFVEKRDGTRVLQGDGPCPRCCARGAVEAQRDAQAKIGRLFGESMLREHYQAALLVDFKPAIRDEVQSHLLRAAGVFIDGPVGVGKTHLLAAALASRMLLGETALYITLPALLTKIRATFGPERAAGAPTEDALLEAAAGVRWLGLDDLGAEKPTEWARAELFQIVDERYSRNRPIIATSNLTLDQLADENVLGLRIVSRLREMCESPITLRGADRRREGEREGPSVAPGLVPFSAHSNA